MIVNLFAKSFLNAVVQFGDQVLCVMNVAKMCLKFADDDNGKSNDGVLVSLCSERGCVSLDTIVPCGQKICHLMLYIPSVSSASQFCDANFNGTYFQIVSK